MLLHTDYENLCESVYDPGKGIDTIPKGGVVYCPLDWIVDFFKKIDGNGKDYIVISANSDLSLYNQRENSTKDDMLRWIEFQKQYYKQDGKEYESFIVNPRANLGKCKQDDTYSVKFYSYTHSTFDKIPSNVHCWFCTNANFEHSKLVRIPFGGPKWTQELIKNADLNQTRSEKIYVNFQRNTLERTDIYSTIYRYKLDQFVVKESVSHEEYVQDLLTHKYVLCMPGNGLSCYRETEVLACGAIPVMPYSLVNSIYAGKAKYFDSLHSFFDGKWFELPKNNAINSKEDFVRELRKVQKLFP